MGLAAYAISLAKRGAGVGAKQIYLMTERGEHWRRWADHRSIMQAIPLQEQQGP